MKPTLGCPCGESNLKRAITYTERPDGETVFHVEGEYLRFYNECLVCGHYFSSHSLCLDGLYSGAYSEATYGTKREEVFDRIMALPQDKSDNFSRCSRIDSFFKIHSKPGYQGKVLDIGSGLGVFPARMKINGWQVTALDPDANAVAHMRSKVGCDCIHGSFLDENLQGIETYDLITFNKVLEHVEDPLGMLEKSKTYLREGGVVYVEVPDGENAILDGPHREEFFIEHHHAFSSTSAALLIKRAGLRMLSLSVLREASRKYTLSVFCDIPEK